MAKLYLGTRELTPALYNDGYSELPGHQISSQGVVSRRSKVLSGNEFTNIISIGNYAMYDAYYSCSGLSGILNLSNLTTVNRYGLYSAFYNCSGITYADLSSLTTIGNSGLRQTFYNNSALTGFDLSSLTTITEGSALYQTFNGCTGLTSVDLSSITTISGSSALYQAFNNCSGLTSVDLSGLTSVTGSSSLGGTFNGCTGLTSVDLSNLTTIGTTSCLDIFYGCSGLSRVDFTSLSSITGDRALGEGFRNATGIEHIYFNSLTTSSFGSSYKTQFSSMMQGTGTTKTHTIHFPSNLETTISTLTGYPTFGGTTGYVTLVFDLPATS